MIRSWYVAVRECWSDRDRRRHVAAMMDRDQEMRAATVEWVEAMATQLAEIRMLPEALEPRR